MAPPRPVVNSFGPTLEDLTWRPVPGGFSGAEIWRGDRAGCPVVALKTWPAAFDQSRLERIHGWMAKAGQLPIVPALFATEDGGTIVSAADRMWDATRWMPGVPRERPDRRDVETASAAIAELHSIWQSESVTAPSPGVLNRLRLLRGFVSTRFDSSAVPSVPTGLNRLVEQTARAVAGAASNAIRALEPWESVGLRCQPCLRDLRGEHVLFTSNRVTGLVDYGAMAIDHPAVDMARLLGDFAEEREDLFGPALRAYRAAGGEIETSVEFLTQLARTGALGAAINWLRRLRNDEVGHLEIARVEERLSRVLRRIERFAPG